MPLESWKPTQMMPRWDMFQRDPDAFYDSIVEMMALALRVPVAMISLLGKDRHRVQSAHGLDHFLTDRSEIPMSHSLCQHVVAMGRPLVVRDAIAHPLVCDNPAIRELGIAAYLGEPLHGADGKPVGTLCVFDTRARDWRDQQRQMLSITAMIVEKSLNWPDGARDFSLN